MFGALVGSFIIGLILLGAFEFLGFPVASDQSDVRRFAIIMAIVCGIFWIIGGLGFAKLLTEIGSWIGYMIAVVTMVWVHQRRHIDTH